MMRSRIRHVMYVTLCVLGALSSVQSVGAEEGREIADRLCGSCHQQGDGLQVTAPPLETTAVRVDWTNVKLREWMATNHRFAPALSANAAELEELRRYLQSIRKKSYLGGLEDLM